MKRFKSNSKPTYIGELLTLISLVAVVGLMLLPTTLSLAVMSVDLGSEFIKIAVVKPGIPMEIVLNKDSRRKSAYAVSFKDAERLFSDGALGVSIKQPPKAFLYTYHLIGKKYEHEMVGLYKKRFPFHNLVKDEERGTVLFDEKDGKFSPEELLGMVLNYTRHAAEAFAEHAMKDIVITVPAYFNQAERRAVISSAKMVGLNVLQLMNDNTAVALNFGIFRSASFNATEKHYMFVDIGATSTTATIVGYSTVKVKDNGYLETVPQLVVKGVGFDPSLGGVEIDFRLRDHLAALFMKTTKAKGDVTENPRAMAKLLKEAKRVKQVLSANTDHTAQIEGLFEDRDFKAKVSRQELEDMVADLTERLPKPIEMALKSSSIPIEDIESVILMGAGTRMPRFQEALLKCTKKTELGKNINTDEAAALGSVYKAADLSAGFKVKRFLVKDANLYPIDVSFERHTTQDDGSVSSKTITRTLFHKLNAFPQKKIMTFNKIHDDFDFNVTYGDMSSYEKELISHLDLGHLKQVSLSEVADVHSKNEKFKSKGIKVYFNMDDSGILNVDKAEAHYEKTAEEAEQEEPTTFQKLGNTLSSLFGSSNEEPKETIQENTEKQPEEEAKETKETEEKKEEESKKEKPEEKTEEDKKDDKKEETTKAEEPKTTSDNSTANNATVDEPTANATASNTTNGNTTEESKPKGPVLVKEPLKLKYEFVDTPDLTSTGFNASVSLLSDLQMKDDVKLETEQARNQLESFVFEFRDKLDDETIQTLSTPEEREKISADLSKASDWLDDEGFDADVKTLRSKLKELKATIEDLTFRIKENENRPILIKQMQSSLNISNVFLEQVKTMPNADEIYKEKDLEDLIKAKEEAKVWLAENWAKQNKTSLTEKPVMLSKDIAAKLGKLDRELLYLINKAKYFVPKRKPKTNSTESKTKKSSNTTKENLKKNGTDDDIKISNETLKEDGNKTEDNTTKPAENGDEKSTTEETIKTEEETKTDSKSEEETKPESKSEEETKSESKSEESNNAEKTTETVKDKIETKEDTTNAEVPALEAPASATEDIKQTTDKNSKDTIKESDNVVDKTSTKTEKQEAETLHSSNKVPDEL